MFSNAYTRVGATVVALLGFSMSGAHAELLKQALTAAYANNPTITSALLAAKVAAENIALRKSVTLPQIGVTGSLGDSFAATSEGFGHEPAVSGGLGYNQTLFDNNKTNANVEEARALVQVADQALATTESNVLLSVVEAYMDVILNTQLVTLRTDTVQFYQSQVKAAQDRQNIGEGTKIDVAQAQASLASGVASEEAAVAALQAAQASYVQWVGHKPANLSSDFNYGTLIPSTVERAIALGDALNPAILSALASIRAAKAGVDVANDSFGPTFGVAGSIGPSLTALCDPTCGADSSSPNAIAGSVKLSLTVPLYSGGALGAATRQAGLSEVQSSVNLQAAKELVDQEVVTAFTALQNDAAQITSAKSAVDAGQLALEGVIQERDVGQQTTLDVLNQEATLSTAQEALISANATRVIGAFTVISAIGKMTAADLGLHTPTKSARPYESKVEDTWEEIRSFK